MKTIHFNTGRKYTTAGQQITATLHDDGVVTFFDHSRSIDGEFDLGTDAALIGGRFDASTVMLAYDRSLWKGSRRAWSDGMQCGGCNSKFEG